MNAKWKTRITKGNAATGELKAGQNEAGKWIPVGSACFASLSTF